MNHAEQVRVITRTEGGEPRQSQDAVVLPLRPVADLVASTGPVVILAGTAASQRTAA